MSLSREIVQATLDSIPGDKILVGHSYGGFVIPNASVGRRTDVRRLVYTAAFVPDTGETIESLGAGYAPPAFLAPGHLVFAPSFPFVIIDRSSTALLRPGSESEAGRGDGGRPAPDEPGHPGQPIGARRLAHPPVVIRRLGRRPGHRPEPAAVHGPARRIDGGPVRRREPRGRVHPLCGAVCEADRASGSGTCQLIATWRPPPSASAAGRRRRGRWR